MARKYAARNDDKSVKSRFVTTAFDDKTRFLLDLAARHERRTVSGIINEAVIAHLRSIKVAEFGKSVSLSDIATEIWSPFEARRFVLQAERFYQTLTFEEQVLWQLIQEEDELWRAGFDRNGNAEHGLKHDLLRDRFDVLKSKAAVIAAKEQMVLIGGSPFRGGRIDTSVPEAIIEPKEQKTKGKVR
jgi:hypothetical protein